MNASRSLATRAALATGALALAVVGMTGTAGAASAAETTPGSGKSSLSSLVSAGTLTQAQSDAIAAADGRQGMRTLVRSGVITRELAQQVKTTVKTALVSVVKKPEAVLASLVAAGTITQSQGDAIEAARPAREHGPRAA
jgi:competence protein ComGC